MQRGALALALWPLSIVFRALVALRRSLYRLGLLKSTRLPVPVIIVGNIFVGGTGKTPLVIWLVEALRNTGYTPGVISRGYGANQRLPQTVNAHSLPQQVGDEPLLIAQRTQCPIMVGRDRSATGQALLDQYPNVDIIISDDGLQHYALARDVEIVLFDERGSGNGWMLPAGPLREPASRRRDFTVTNISQSSTPPNLLSIGNIIEMRLDGDHAECLADRSQQLLLSALPALAQQELNRPARIIAAAGIGNPGRFFAMLRQAGLKFQEMPLPDHFDFASNPFGNKEADYILITEKDAVKCARLESPENLRRLWVVPVSARIDAALTEQIMEKLSGSRTA